MCDSDGESREAVAYLRNAALLVLSAVGTLLTIYQELVSFPRPRLKPELEDILRIPPAPYISSSAVFLLDRLLCVAFFIVPNHSPLLLPTPHSTLSCAKDQ